MSGENGTYMSIQENITMWYMANRYAQSISQFLGFPRDVLLKPDRRPEWRYVFDNKFVLGKSFIYGTNCVECVTNMNSDCCI